MWNIMNIPISDAFQKKVNAIRKILHGAHVYSIYLQRWGRAAPNPVKTINCDPNRISHFPVPRLYHRHELHHFGSWVICDDWHNWPVSGERWMIPEAETTKKLRIDRWGFYSSLKSSLQEGIPYQETEYFQYMLDHSDRDREWFLDDYRRTKRIYESIQNQGYKSQADLSSLPIRPGYDEIRVSIDAHGQIDFFGGGRHRLVIAKLLDLEEVPVRVVVRHPQWQELRKEIASGAPTTVLSSSTVSTDHPDLQRLL